MAWATTDPVPANLSITVPISVFASALNEQTIKIICQSSAGGIFDFTACTGVILQGDNGLQFPLNVTQSEVPTLGTHDATSLTCTVTGTQFAAIMAKVGANGARATIIASDSITSLIVAYGRINFQLTA